MKTEDRWVIPVDLTNLVTDEISLPVIGNSHISSILSTLDSTEKTRKNQLEESTLIIQQSESDYKLPVITTEIPNAKFPIRKKKPKTQYYIFCNFCPFLCLNNKKITTHIAKVHDNKIASVVGPLKCPACTNVFYHNTPLESHLIHDHYVTNKSELKRIVLIVTKAVRKISYPTQISRNAELSLSTEKVSTETEQNDQSPKSEPDYPSSIDIDTTYSDDEQDINKIATIDKVVPKVIVEAVVEHTVAQEEDNVEAVKETPALICLPTVDLSLTYTQRMINHSLKKRDNGSINKFLDTKNTHRCQRALCNVRLQSQDKIKYHMKCHSGGAFVCIECNEKFSTWKPLSGHLWRVHRVDMDLYACDQCEYRTFSLAKLNNTHRLIHGDAKNYTCNTCARAFKNSKQMRNHRATMHATTTMTTAGDESTTGTLTVTGGGAVHVCEVCTKVFGDRRRLKQHADTVHKKLKPFLCNYCGYKGATRATLKAHIRQHTGEKPFSCDVCEFTSSDHNSLRRHKLRHSGKRPYKCTHCDYSCIQSNTYKVHLKTKHPGLEKDLLFSCDQCSFRSVSKDVYLSHVAAIHSENN